MEGVSVLQVSPAELTFVFASNCELQNVLNLRNTLEDGRSVAFKVKCNTADRYLVRPTSGYVRPGASVNIKVFMLPQSEYSNELRSCKDRFLIQSAPVDDSTEEPPVAEILATHQRQDFKISVTVAPPLALRSVLEGEIRAFASQQGVDGHRQCMRKFLELLLARGVLSQSQVLLAFGVVAELFNGVQDTPRESLAATRADSLSKWSRMGSGASASSLSPRPSNGIAEEQGPKSHVFQEDPNAKPLFPSLKGNPLGLLPKRPSGFMGAGRTSSGSIPSTGSPSPAKGWERHSRQSSGSEAGNGVQEPPPTPASASHTPSLASSYNSGAAAASARATYPTLKGAGEKLARGARAKKAASSPGRGGADSEGEDVFQDAAEALPGLPGGAPSTAGVVGRVI